MGTFIYGRSISRMHFASDKRELLYADEFTFRDRLVWKQRRILRSFTYSGELGKGVSCIVWLVVFCILWDYRKHLILHLSN